MQMDQVIPVDHNDCLVERAGIILPLYPVYPEEGLSLTATNCVSDA